MSGACSGCIRDLPELDGVALLQRGKLRLQARDVGNGSRLGAKVFGGRIANNVPVEGGEALRPEELAALEQRISEPHNGRPVRFNQFGRGSACSVHVDVKLSDFREIIGETELCGF
jgi:hypothetical protein